MKISVRIQDQFYTVEIADLRARPIVAEVEGQQFEIWPAEAGPAELPSPDTSAQLRQPPAPSPFTGIASPSGALQPREVRAPMPGTIVAIHVQPGQAVQRGQDLLTLEAMKMRNIIRAAREGRVSAIPVVAGQAVNHNDILVEMEG